METRRNSRTGRADLGRDFVCLDRRQRLALAHLVANLFEPLSERALDQRVGQLRHADERFAHRFDQSCSRNRFIAPSSAPASMPSSARWSILAHT